MSVDKHRHCQATVLGATGTPSENGTTWTTISNLKSELSNLPSNWLEYFVHSINVTDDLAGILKLINWLAGQSSQSSQQNQKPLAGDLINVHDRTVGVKHDMGDTYEGPVGIAGTGSSRRLTSFPIRVQNEEDDGPAIATLYVGDQPIVIRGKKESGGSGPGPIDPPVQERYVITEDRDFDIVLSGGMNDGVYLDYND